MRRVWNVDTDPVTGEVDRQQVLQVFADCEALGHLVGGSFVAAPKRVQLADNGSATPEYVTVGWIVEWRSFAPAGREPEDAADAGDHDAAGAV